MQRGEVNENGRNGQTMEMVRKFAAESFKNKLFLHQP